MRRTRARGERRTAALTLVVGAVTAVVFAAGSALAGASASLAAQDDRELPVSWSVRPADLPGESRANFVLEADPGDTIRDGLVVENLGDVDLVLGVYASDAFNTPEGGIDLLASAEDAVDLGTWVTPEQTAITLPAGQTLEVPFTISVPDDATAGDHVGGIVTSLTVSEPDADGNWVQIERRLGTRIYLRVSGELAPELTFTALETSYAANANPFAPGTMTVTYAVENTGNVRLRSTRSVRVQGSFGVSDRVADAADMAELLPDNSYEFTQDVEGVWPAFGTTVEVELEPYDPAGAPLNPAPRPVIARTTTTLVPVPQIVLIAVVALGVLLAWRNRRRRRRELDQVVDKAVSEAIKAAQAAAPPAPRPPPTPPPFPSNEAPISTTPPGTPASPARQT